MNLFNNLQRVCLKSNLDVFSFLPVTFVFNCEDLNFFTEIDHFFRYFKGLRVFNFLRQQENKKAKEFEKTLVEEVAKDQEKETSGEKVEDKVEPEPIDPEKKGQETQKDAPTQQKVDPQEKEKEEFALRPLIIKIVKEIKKLEAKKDNKGENPETSWGLEFATLKKLSQVMNFPGHSEEDGVADLLIPASFESPAREEQKQPAKLNAPDSKWHYIARFRRSLFNKKKKLVRVPDAQSTFGCYYYSRLRHSFNQGRNLWLLKVSQYNRGFGIELFRDLAKFSQHLCNFKMGYEEALVDSNPGESVKAKSKAMKPESSKTIQSNSRNQKIEHDDSE